MAEPVNSIDAAQRVGFLGTPEGWREVCRLYRRRMSVHDCEQMAKLRTYIEEGLLVVVRPEHVSGVPAPFPSWTNDDYWLARSAIDALEAQGRRGDIDRQYATNGATRLRSLLDQAHAVGAALPGGGEQQ